MESSDELITSVVSGISVIEEIRSPGLHHASTTGPSQPVNSGRPTPAVMDSVDVDGKG